MEKTFGDIMVGDKLYCTNLEFPDNFIETRIISMELDENALKEINERVPDVVITTQDFQIKVSKIILAYSKPKVYVTETGMYIGPSLKNLKDILLKEVNSKLDYWEKRKKTIIEAYNNTINMNHTDVRKHDYPYYFDENGVDHYPMIIVE